MTTKSYLWTWLTRIDSDSHANRWYAVGVQPGLFDPVAVVRFWGSRETAFQQMQIEAFEDQEAARAAADRVIRDKIRQRGYHIAGGYEPPGLDQDVGEPAPDGDGELVEGKGVGECPLCEHRLGVTQTALWDILYCPVCEWGAVGTGPDGRKPESERGQ